MKPTMGSDAETARRMHLAMDVPLLRFLGAVAIDDRDPAAGIELVQSANVLNGVNALHGGVIATVLETAAYLALLPQLADDEDAVTHVNSLSYVARPEAGAKLIATAEVLRVVAASPSSPLP